MKSTYSPETTTNLKNGTMPNQSALLPFFPGFYESRLDGFMDDEIDMEMEDTGEDYDTVSARFDADRARLAISTAWVAAFSKETGILMELEEIASPKEYNFTTDRLFVTLPPETVRLISPARKSPEFADILKKWFTSRDGFLSFYSNDPADKEWQIPVEEWDHNQLGALLAAYVLSKGTSKAELLDTLYTEPRVYEAAGQGWVDANRLMV